MTDIELEAQLGKPYDGAHAVLDIEGGPFLPEETSRGDVNYLCGHCRFALAQQMPSNVYFVATPPGVTFRCPQCRKYSLLRMTGEQVDQAARYGAD